MTFRSAVARCAPDLGHAGVGADHPPGQPAPNFGCGAGSRVAGSLFGEGLNGRAGDVGQALADHVHLACVDRAASPGAEHRRVLGYGQREAVPVGCGRLGARERDGHLVGYELSAPFVRHQCPTSSPLVLAIGALCPPRHLDHHLSLNSARCIGEALQLGEHVDKVRVLAVTQRRPGAHQVDDLLRDRVR